jgi:RNA polymerase sigma factor (sigma-70 family)
MTLRYTDRELLDQFTKTGSPDAFAQIVRRHADLVYASAVRRVRDRHTAEDVMQATFLVLWRRGSSIGSGIHLAAWLLRVSRHTAANAIRMEQRRRRHEQEAGETMKQHSNASQSTDDPWLAIVGHLDDAVLSLPQLDRTVIIQRYFEQKSASEIATSLNISTEAARQRLSRAIKKLRKTLDGYTADGASAAALSEILLSRSVETTPATVITRETMTTAGGTPNAIANAAIRAMSMAKYASLAAALLLVTALTTVIAASNLLKSPMLVPNAPSTPASAASAPSPPAPISENPSPQTVREDMRQILIACRAFADDPNSSARIKHRWPNSLAELKPYLKGGDIDLDQYLYCYMARPGSPDGQTAVLLEKYPERRQAVAPFVGGQFIGFGDGQIQYVQNLNWHPQRKTRTAIMMFLTYEDNLNPDFRIGVGYTFADPTDPAGKKRIAVCRAIFASDRCFSSAELVLDADGRGGVKLNIAPTFQKTLTNESKEWIGEHFAIVLEQDGKPHLLGAPLVDKPIENSISLPPLFTENEAMVFVDQINSVIMVDLRRSGPIKGTSGG